MKLIEKKNDRFVIEFTRKELAMLEKAMNIFNSLHLTTLFKTTEFWLTTGYREAKDFLDTQIKYLKENTDLEEFLTKILCEEADSDA